MCMYIAELDEAVSYTTASVFTNSYIESSQLKV